MRPLIVLGFSARAAAFSAKAAGFQPYAIDLFADRDLAAVCPSVKIRRYPRDFLAALGDAPAASWVYTGGLENFPALVDRLAEVRQLFGNTGKALRKARDCRRVAEAAQAVGLPFPRTRLANGTGFGLSPEGARTGLARGRTWLIKPRRGSGGIGIREVSAGEDDLPPRSSYWQEVIEGESASAVFVSANGRATLLGTTRQLAGRDFAYEPPFLYVGSIAPLILREEELARLRLLGGELARRLELAGLWNVDFIRTTSDLWPLEVNPRYSASIEVLERASGRNFVSQHVTACESGILEDEREVVSTKVVGKAVAYAQKSGVVSASFDELIESWNRPGCPPEVFDLPRTGERIQAGHPVATVMTTARTEVEVERVLRDRLSLVKNTVSCES